MKKFWVGIVFALFAVVGRAEDKILCNAVSTATSSWASTTNAAPGACIEFDVPTAKSLRMSIRAAGATTSQAVLQYLPCSSPSACDWVQYPKSGETPITDIGSDPLAKTRDFVLTFRAYRVRWKILDCTDCANKITGWVSYEY